MQPIGCNAESETALFEQYVSSRTILRRPPTNMCDVDRCIASTAAMLSLHCHLSPTIVKVARRCALSTKKIATARTIA